MNPRNDETTLDPVIQRELDALDAALAGRPLADDLADLAELAAELNELRETPSEEFASTLDAGAAAGFPGRLRAASLFGQLPGREIAARAARRWRGAAPLHRLMPALAGATTVIVVATAVVVSTSGDGGDGAGTVAGSQEGGAPPADAPLSDSAAFEGRRLQEGVPGYRSLQKGLQRAGGPGGDGLSAARRALSADEAPLSRLTVPPPPGPGTAPGVRDRRVERSADLTLGTDAEDLRDVTSKAFDVIGRQRGIVLRSSIDEGDEGEANASFELLIPSGRLSAALADLSALAEVRSRSENALDITAPFVSARERLRDARAEAEGLLGQLAEADTDTERASVKAQLEIVRGRIAAFRSQVNRLERRSSFSRVSLVVVTGDEVSTVPGTEDVQWTIGDAFDDAGRILAVAAGIALVALALALPLTLIGGTAWTARRRYLRRVREQALGT